MQTLTGNLEESNRLDSSDFEALAAADVLASHQVVCAHHVALRLGETGPVALVGIARKLRLFAADKPSDLVLAAWPQCGQVIVWVLCSGFSSKKSRSSMLGSPPGLACLQVRRGNPGRTTAIKSIA